MDHYWGVVVGMEDILLLDSSASGASKEITMKKMIISKEKNKGFLLLTCYCVLSSPVQCTYTSHRD